MTITDQTPMEIVIDMFRKLGLRITLVTHNGFVDLEHTILSFLFVNLLLELINFLKTFAGRYN